MKAGSYELQMKVKSNLDDLAQLPVTVYLDNIIKGTLSFRGSKGQWVHSRSGLIHSRDIII